MDEPLLDPVFRATNPDFSTLLPPADVTSSARDPLEKRLAMEFTGRLCEGSLMPMDKVSMAHSLEVRMPFLHRPIMEFALSLPSNMKIRHGQEKYILNRLNHHVPKEVAQRKKFGLRYTDEPAIANRFVQPAWEMLLDGNNPFIDRSMLEHALPSLPFPKIWPLLVLQLWWNEFMVGSCR